MQTLGKPATTYFEQWKMLFRGLAQNIWMKVIDKGDPENDGAAFDEDEDGFIRKQCSNASSG